MKTKTFEKSESEGWIVSAKLAGTVKTSEKRGKGNSAVKKVKAQTRLGHIYSKFDPRTGELPLKNRKQHGWKYSRTVNDLDS